MAKAADHWQCHSEKHSLREQANPLLPRIRSEPMHLPHSPSGGRQVSSRSTSYESDSYLSQAQAVPWYHFVPVQYSYSDLWDILSFLDGAPDGSTEGHEDIARDIARHGVEFAHAELRREEMQSYMFLFLLEVGPSVALSAATRDAKRLFRGHAQYRRAWSDDRRAATYTV